MHSIFLNYLNSKSRISLREGEERESWRSVDKSQLEHFKQTPFAQWGYGAGELVQTAEKIIKVTLRFQDLVGFNDCSAVWLVRPSRTDDLAPR